MGAPSHGFCNNATHSPLPAPDATARETHRGSGDDTLRARWLVNDVRRCDHPPNRRAARALALAASSSRSFGGAAVSSEASNRSEILAMSSTAE